MNPDFAAYAELCGAKAVKVTRPDELRPALEAALGHMEGPSLVAVAASNRDV